MKTMNFEKGFCGYTDPIEIKNKKGEVEVVNLTPHAINILDADNKIVKTFESSSSIARCTCSRNQIGNVNGIAINSNYYGEVTGLPAPKDGTIYLVSALVAQAVKAIRKDVFVTDDAVRNDDGQIIGCRAFARI